MVKTFRLYNILGLEVNENGVIDVAKKDRTHLKILKVERTKDMNEMVVEALHDNETKFPSDNKYEVFIYDSGKEDIKEIGVGAYGTSFSLKTPEYNFGKVNVSNLLLSKEKCEFIQNLFLRVGKNIENEKYEILKDMKYLQNKTLIENIPVRIIKTEF